jgi:hypothetical protein
MMFSGIKSLRGNTCVQVFTNGKYVHLEPGERKSQAGEALGLMIDKVRIPDKIVFDGAKEQSGKTSEFMRLVRKNRISFWQTKLSILRVKLGLLPMAMRQGTWPPTIGMRW